MKAKLTGLFLLIFSLVLGIIFIVVSTELSAEGEAAGCFPTAECSVIQTSLSLVHFAFGVLGFFLALAFFMIFLSRDDEKLMKKIDDEKIARIQEEKFSIMLKLLDASEKKVLTTLRSEPGITQATLVIKTGLSKSKVSEILSDFERKNVIKRAKKGKTRSIYLVEKF